MPSSLSIVVSLNAYSGRNDAPIMCLTGSTGTVQVSVICYWVLNHTLSLNIDLYIELRGPLEQVVGELLYTVVHVQYMYVMYVM